MSLSCGNHVLVRGLRLAEDDVADLYFRSFFHDAVLTVAPPVRVSQNVADLDGRFVFLDAPVPVVRCYSLHGVEDGAGVLQNVPNRSVPDVPQLDLLFKLVRVCLRIRAAREIFFQNRQRLVRGLKHQVRQGCPPSPERLGGPLSKHGLERGSPLAGCCSRVSDTARVDLVRPALVAPGGLVRHRQGGRPLG